MAALELASALATLRSLLGDATDKYEFRVGAQPAPNGLTTKFFLGQTRLLDDTVQVFLDGEVVNPSGTLDLATGTVELSMAPATNSVLEASYYYRWFTDAELEAFLTQAANVLRYDAITATDLPVGLRPAAYDFACYHAFMRKAAEYADTLEASGGGVSASQKGSHPNWRSLADAAYKTGKDKLELYADDPLARKTPGMRFVTFNLPDYQPIGFA